MIQEIKTTEEYKNIITTNKFIVIHFWAAWNRYDLTMRERLEELNTKFKGTVVFFGVNVDLLDLVDLIRNAKVCNIPALAYYHNGNLLETIIGLMSANQIQRRINTILNAN
ncbi:MAG: thioredoxin family protein [Pyrinomonadaceae bacterium]